MAISTTSDSLQKCMADLRSIWGDGQDRELPVKAQALLERLLTSARPEEPWMAELIREGKPRRELYRDPKHEFILKGHIHKAGHGSTPHDHGLCWVLYGVYQGEIEITRYRRTDDGSVPGQARLEKVETARLTPGVVKAYLPGDIHTTHAIASPFSVVFRFLSYDLDKVERYRYDLETGTVSLD